MHTRSLHTRSLATRAVLMGLVAGTAMLVACNKGTDNRTADTAAQGASRARALAPESPELAGRADGAGTTAAVKARLAGDQSLSALDINVEVSGGNVVLRGIAPDTAARTRATELARSVNGVTGVDNQLSVQVRAQ